MLKFDADREIIALTGRSGSGKSTFAIRYLLNAGGLACRFIFDPRSEFSTRLGVRSASSARELEAAVAGQWVIYNPHRMFPDRTTDAFQFFCKWVFNVSQRGSGRKVLLVDEVWKYCTPHEIPLELAEIVQEGRKAEIDVMFATQRPNRMNESITGEVTEAVCFALAGQNAIKTMEGLDIPATVSAHLPNGHYYAVNRNTGGILRGRVF